MIPFEKKEVRIVDDAQMQQVYETLKTPYKYGAVIKFDHALCDSPSIFRYQDTWYMLFVKIDKQTQTSGYETHFAKSKDLLTWEYLYPVLKRSDENVWDSKQVAGYAAFVENNFDGKFALQSINGKYYFAYLGGNLDGYETDPLSMGQGTIQDINSENGFCKFPKPVLSAGDIDAREGENLTVYKAYMFEDTAKTLGYPYVNIYNAKGPNGKESIFIAVSNDAETWVRYGEKPIIFDDTLEQNIAINGDPQVIKLGDLYIMVYFIWQKGKAFNSFACSYDLVNWTKWQGAPLIESEFEWENKFAHKPWIVVDNGIVYHYYCAVNDKGERFIALATSKRI